MLVDLYKKAKVPDYMNMCRCLVFLDEASAIAELFISLLTEEVEVRISD
jgi:26S proteasome regulatory subunit N2